MKQTVMTLMQLKRLRGKAVTEMTVELAKQKQVGIRYDNNIKALGYLLQKNDVSGAGSSNAEALKNLSGYKGSLQRVIEWQKQEKALAKVKEDRIQSSLTDAACREKGIAVALEERQEALARDADVKQQKAIDEIAGQCWQRRMRGVS